MEPSCGTCLYLGEKCSWCCDYDLWKLMSKKKKPSLKMIEPGPVVEEMLKQTSGLTTPWMPKDMYYCFTDLASPSGQAMIKGLGETPREETVMQTYRFEIVVPRVTDDVTGKETKPAALIAKGEGLLEEPNAADLLQDAGEALTKAGRKASEASVNIRPFCG